MAKVIPTAENAGDRFIAFQIVLYELLSVLTTVVCAGLTLLLVHVWWHFLLACLGYATVARWSRGVYMGVLHRWWGDEAKRMLQGGPGNEGDRPVQRDATWPFNQLDIRA